MYAPRLGRPVNKKNKNYYNLQELFEGVTFRDAILIIRDLNGHMGIERTGIENVIGAFSAANKSTEGEIIIVFCVSTAISITITFYQHQESHK